MKARWIAANIAKLPDVLLGLNPSAGACATSRTRGQTQSPLTGSSVSAAELADANRGIFIRNAEMRGMPSA
jgi:hypothetical protein